MAVVVGVGALGALWAWLGVGARVDVYLVWAAGGLRAAGVLLRCVWWLVLSGGGWLGYALRGWCRCGCLGLGAGCGCAVCAVWSGVMVGSPACVAGWWRVWSSRRGLGGGGGSGWTAWWLWRRWAALMMGLGCVVAGGRVWWWWRDGVSLRVLLGVVPWGVWFAITEHSPSGWRGPGGPVARPAGSACPLGAQPSLRTAAVP